MQRGNERDVGTNSGVHELQGILFALVLLDLCGLRGIRLRGGLARKANFVFV